MGENARGEAEWDKGGKEGGGSRRVGEDRKKRWGTEGKGVM